MTRPHAALAALALAAALAGVLAGCSDPGAPVPPTATAATPAPTASASATAAATPTPTPAPTGPTAAAAARLPQFRTVVKSVWAGNDKLTGRAYIDALVAAGFDKKAMQLTPDASTVGSPAETILFSVRIGGGCLIGQVGPDTGSPVAAVETPVGSDTCLFGRTRPIDW